MWTVRPKDVPDRPRDVPTKRRNNGPNNEDGQMDGWTNQPTKHQKDGRTDQPPHKWTDPLSLFINNSILILAPFFQMINLLQELQNTRKMPCCNKP